MTCRVSLTVSVCVPMTLYTIKPCMYRPSTFFPQSVFLEVLRLPPPLYPLTPPSPYFCAPLTTRAPAPAPPGASVQLFAREPCTRGTGRTGHTLPAGRTSRRLKPRAICHAQSTSVSFGSSSSGGASSSGSASASWLALAAACCCSSIATARSDLLGGTKRRPSGFT